MAVLPDYLAPGLAVIFCGTVVGTTSARRAHYYAGPGNEFWLLLHESGLTPKLLASEDDASILEHGIGLTDLNKTDAQSSDSGLRYDVPGFVTKIEHYEPAWVAFHGKEAAKAVSRALRQGSKVRLGLQAWSIGPSHVFVVPSGSGANRDPSRLEGRSSRTEWFGELTSLVRQS